MKKTIIIILTLLSINSYSQVNINEIKKFFLEEQYEAAYNQLWPEAEKGDKTALAALSYIVLQDNLTFEFDEVQLQKWIEPIAEQDDSFLLALGKFYSWDSNFKKDIPKALTYLNKAKDNGSEEAIYRIGLLYYMEENYPKAFDFFSQASSKSSDAMNKIGEMYFNGFGKEVDFRLAFYYFSMAADQDNIEALHNLSAMFTLGKGVPKSDEKAFAFKLKAALLNSSQDMVEVGRNYQVGLHTSLDVSKAFYWFEKSAKMGNKYGMHELGNLYLNGIGVKQDNKLAFEWFLKAANKKDTSSMVMLGKMYLQGDGVIKDKALAVTWLQKAATTNDAEAKEMLAGLGIKTPK
ncbi:hypothetical protein [Flavobacterium sp.]|uniref:tetratricopeptide repeat protein n=1 Tax=Flavobacterium sp. TaxID=239 RepID=UPI003B9CC0C3